jgi:hypothetical protein
VKEKEVGDRQLDALLERLDKLQAELARLNRRLDSGEHLAPVVRELAVLNGSRWYSVTTPPSTTSVQTRPLAKSPKKYRP